MKKTVLILCMLCCFFGSRTLYAGDQTLASATSSASIIEQIMGGTEAPTGGYPWMTAILLASQPDLYNAQYCGGTLIAPNWVLTAGHCVDDKVASEIQVAVGVYDLKNWSGTRISVKRIVKHPAYVDYLANDIALLELSSSTGQQPITIFSGASVQEIDPTLLNQMTTVMGWGDADGSTGWYYPSILRQVNLPVVANTYCNVGFGVTLLGSQICAGYAATKDACGGDSGGPMVALIDGQWTHVGLVSYGGDCELVNGYYGVYTRSSAFVDFIKQYVPAAQFSAGSAPATSKSMPWLLLLLNKTR